MPHDHKTSRAARTARWYANLKKNPQRWAERMKKQRKRRESEKIREAERQQAREQWAKLPKDHPRKTRKTTRNPATLMAKRQRDMEILPDSVVANRYLHMAVGDCPKSLISIKREHIRLNRMLGTRIKSL